MEGSKDSGESSGEEEESVDDSLRHKSFPVLRIARFRKRRTAGVGATRDTRRTGEEEDATGEEQGEDGLEKI